jgi:hypothetical protein
VRGGHSAGDIDMFENGPSGGDEFAAVKVCVCVCGCVCAYDFHVHANFILIFPFIRDVTFSHLFLLSR